MKVKPPSKHGYCNPGFTRGRMKVHTIMMMLLVCMGQVGVASHNNVGSSF